MQPYHNQYGGYPPPHQPPVPPPAPPNPYRKPIRRTTNIVCGGLLIMLLLGYSLDIIYLGVLGAWEIPLYNVPPIVWQLLNILFSTLRLGAPILLIKALCGLPAQTAFPMRSPRPGLVAAGTCLFMGVSLLGQIVAGGIGSLLGKAGLGGAAAFEITPYGFWPVVAYVFSRTFCPAILEELLFRGVILQSLRRYGDGFALVCSALLFAFAHRDLARLPAIVAMGLLMGYFVLYTGSLVPGMVFHFANNLMAVLVSVVGIYSAKWAYILNLALYPLYILLGTVGLIVLLSHYRMSFRPAPSGYPLAEADKYGMFFTSVCAILFFLVALVLTLLGLVP